LTRRLTARSRLAAQTLTPIQSVSILDENGLRQLAPESIRIDVVGLKAWGISCLPTHWTLPVLVVSGQLARIGVDANDLRDALRSIGVDDGAEIIVRSSGVKETLRQRGRLASKHCSARDALAAIAALSNGITEAHGVVHWLVQPYFTQRALGHLSNERRLSYEKRDWVAEVEPRHGRKGVTTSVAVRRWRDGSAFTTEAFACSSEAQITLRLKTIALWAMAFADRMHFEWLWDGKRLFLVQADREESNFGVDPRDSLKVEVPAASLGTLETFRLCTPADFTLYKKLANAKTYAELGYEMPPFYILTEVEAIAAILAGNIPEAVRSDLRRLTTRPLIIRTDGEAIPSEKREMLPRSDELRSEGEACEWLQNGLATTLASRELSDARIVLIAHHFVPAVAAAWARAEPGRPNVRIEALWGVPEGLYWYSHDTYQVVTRAGKMSAADSLPANKFPYSKRLRFKGSFVAPDVNGAFVHRATAPPADWKRAVSKDVWLSEIAWTTRRVAELKGEPIALMWFVDTHPAASKHRVLPWFHEASRLDERPTAAPRNKYRYSADFRIESEPDWKRLQSEIQAGATIERVVVEPIDALLLRNAAFAEKLAEVAKKHGIVVELSGGILSHAYYVLSRAGAKVECVDLVGDESDVVEYDKLIRDKIPDGMASRGEIAETVQLTGDALIVALQQKIVEEGLEVLNARSGDEMIAELADVVEVSEALANALGETRGRIDEARAAKRRQKGGFERGIMLLRTATPGTLPPTHAVDVIAELEVTDGGRRVISDAALLPSKATYRRPDLRQTSPTALEKVLTVEVDIARLLDPPPETFQFTLPDASGGEDSFTITIELKRSQATLRATVRLRRSEPQLSLRIE
jgi:predicted house-cleaning noncanonical NTP pyrophosphatase (MazG superfamily)